LNLCAEFGGRPRGPAVLTPHPGEAARLLGTSAAAVQCDRFAAARRLALDFRAVAVLKGAGSIVDDGATAGVCLHGNEGMASAGMGDVLTGIVGALLAQGLSARDAARAATCLHSRAADVAVAEAGVRGLIATDLIAALRHVLNAESG
jgi:NAD(P)H-hydrate epimerase